MQLPLEISSTKTDISPPEINDSTTINTKDKSPDSNDLSLVQVKRYQESNITNPLTYLRSILPNLLQLEYITLDYTLPIKPQLIQPYPLGSFSMM